HLSHATATTAIHSLTLHDALPIYLAKPRTPSDKLAGPANRALRARDLRSNSAVRIYRVDTSAPIGTRGLGTLMRHVLELLDGDEIGRASCREREQNGEKETSGRQQ